MKKLALYSLFLFFCTSSIAQSRTMMVYKNGIKTFEMNVADNDTILFNVSDTVMDVDGNVYRTIKIGNKLWMVDNLRTTKLNDGSPIANITTDNIKFANGVNGLLRITPAFCWHNNLEYNKWTYGALYNWFTVETGKLAPTGWRVATKEDWAELEDYLARNGFNYDGTKSTDGSVTKILKSMASDQNWSSNSVKGTVGNNIKANNKSGLSLLPGGYRDGNTWGITGNAAGYWSASAYDSIVSNSRSFGVTDSGVVQTRTDAKQLAYSVRCVKDILPEPTAGALTDATLTTARNSITTKLNTAFDLIKEKPLIEAPIDAGYTTESGVPMSRTKSYSLSNYAFKCLWLNYKVDSANIALTRNADYYLNNPASYFAEADNFYWSADIWLKLIEYYGSKGSIAAGRITAATEARLYELMFKYMDYFSTKGIYSPTSYTEYLISKTWTVYGSENHHAQQLYTFWHFSKLLNESDLYKTRAFANGSLPAEFYVNLTAYLKNWISERAKKGIVEMANESYNEITLKGIYNMYDFATDTELSELACKFLDLYWALWAQESISGIRGGGKARIYPGNDANGWQQPLRELAYYYISIGAAAELANAKFTILTSKYRMPFVVMDMALRKSEMGVFENRERAPGLAINGKNGPPEYKLRQDYGGVVRYTYCTPDFIMGSAQREARLHTDWTMISDQNNWQGVIFGGEPVYRIFTYASNERASYNGVWNAQSKGCMISAPLLPNYGKYTDSMRVYISPWGLTGRIERSGWTFLQSNTGGGAYIAIKCVRGTFKLISNGRYNTCNVPTSPVIIEVGRKADFASFTAFQDKIIALPLTDDGKVVRHTTIYNDTMEFYTDKTSAPKINGKVVDYRPTYLYDSPFVKSVFNSGVVTISKNKRSLTLNFNLK